ncbi:olfactory receptor 8S1-like [Delphinapterus leucas]|uniref:Olfactory receptor n=1 Tax=Delphinapterus leucas TaxID=9749 RepID=A0A7F8KC46_DELLE|nr:olfactory receptor 8S1-like [Delphinapterus leucas]
MTNLSITDEFVLLGLSSDPEIQTMLFVLFLGIYLLTLIGNLTMILLIRADSHLHMPMYFFLGHLSFLDICYSLVTVPKMLQNFLSQKKTISVWGCITQSFFFMISGVTESCLLSATAYDRYAAMCHPLLYTVVMNRPLCTAMVGTAWLMGFLNSLVNNLCVQNLQFYGPNIISHFSCELPSHFPLSCSDTTPNTMLLASFKNQEAKAALQRMLRQQICVSGNSDVKIIHEPKYLYENSIFQIRSFSTPDKHKNQEQPR